MKKAVTFYSNWCYNSTVFWSVFSYREVLNDPGIINQWNAGKDHFHQRIPSEGRYDHAPLRMGTDGLPGCFPDLSWIVTDTASAVLVPWKNTSPMTQGNTTGPCRWICRHFIIPDDAIHRILRSGSIISCAWLSCTQRRYMSFALLLKRMNCPPDCPSWNPKKKNCSLSWSKRSCTSFLRSASAWWPESQIGP